MALNLWEIGGQPTSYNPLSQGVNNNINIRVGEYILKFKAKSPTSGSIRIQTSNSSYDKSLSLTNEFKNFTEEVKVTSEGKLYFLSHVSSDDIIEDIQLVQKPLPTLTINGIDGFKSGKWTLHENARVIDDETLEVNPTSNFQPNKLTIPCLPNQKYHFVVQSDNQNVYPAIYYNSDSSGATNLYDGYSQNKLETSVEITTPSNATTLIIQLTNKAIGKFTFKRPMLNLGTTPAPYERKTGERMVLPTPVNLFDKQVEQGYYDMSTGSPYNSAMHKRTVNFISVDVSKKYYISKNTANNFFVHHYDLNKNWIGRTQYTGLAFVELNAMPLNCAFIRFHFDDSGSAGVDYSKYAVYYAVRLNKKPKRYVPKKNLIQGVEQGAVVGSDLSNDNVSAFVTKRVRTTNIISLTRNKSFTLSAKETNIQAFVWFGTDSSLGQWFDLPFTFNSNSYDKCRIQFRKPNDSIITPNEVSVMLVEGSTLQPYEPYQEILPRAKSGLAFNGVTDYIEVPYRSEFLGDKVVWDVEFICGKVDNSYQAIVSHRHNQASPSIMEGYILYIAPTTGEIQLWTGQTPGWNMLNSGVFVKVGEKYSVQFIVDYTSLTQTLIINGQQFIRNNSIMTKITKNPLRIGAGQNETASMFYFGGTILKAKFEGVFEYDFTNPSNIVGNKVLQNAQNLIPSFEDPRWSLHANADVLGKDVLRLEASGSLQTSAFVMPTKPITTYLFDMLTNGVYSIYSRKNGVNTATHANIASSKQFTFTTNSDADDIRIAITNNNAGTFDFIKPQLYELTGKEGTLMGKPTPLLKQAKRLLYAKR